MAHKEDFEQTFVEQLEYIQKEQVTDEVDFSHLPDALKVEPNDPHFCFPLPESEIPASTPAEILSELTWEEKSRKRSAAMMVRFSDEELLKTQLLTNVTSEQQEAAARILAILVCAEESAVNIFNHECKRISEEQVIANRLALAEIETEERVHDWLIKRAREFYPTPGDIHSIRRRTRLLFMRVASRDLGTHFARISGLDSGVCICLTALLGSKTVTGIQGFADLIRHIRRDEASHVKKARAHALDLGFDSTQFGEAYEMTRQGVVDMLKPIATSFEAMGVDPDRLFKRLVRYQNPKEALL